MKTFQILITFTLLLSTLTSNAAKMRLGDFVESQYHLFVSPKQTILMFSKRFQCGFANLQDANLFLSWTKELAESNPKAEIESNANSYECLVRFLPLAPMAVKVDELIKRLYSMLPQERFQALVQINTLENDKDKLTTISHVADVLGHDDNEEVRAQAVRTISKIDHVDSVPAIVKALDDESMIVRYNSVMFLGRLKAKDAISQLQALLDEEENLPMREAIKTAIQNIQEQKIDKKSKE